MRRDASGRRTLIVVEERGDRLRALAREWGIRGADGMALTLVCDAVLTAYRAQREEEERAAVMERHARLRRMG